MLGTENQTVKQDSLTLRDTPDPVNDTDGCGLSLLTIQLIWRNKITFLPVFVLASNEKLLDLFFTDLENVFGTI